MNDEEHFNEVIRAGNIVLGSAFAIGGVPLSGAVMTSIGVQLLAYMTDPRPQSFSWRIGMVASASLGWGLSETLKREVFKKGEVKRGR